MNVLLIPAPCNVMLFVIESVDVQANLPAGKVTVPPGATVFTQFWTLARLPLE